MAKGFEWHGDRVLKRMQQAARFGINRTMVECVVLAKSGHPFTNRSGMAERSIRIAMPAKTDARGSTAGLWGSMGVKYFRALEFGTRKTRTRTSIRARNRIMRTGVLKTGRMNRGLPPWQGGSFKPTLRPVAARVYPRLPGNIKAGWRKAG